MLKKGFIIFALGSMILMGIADVIMKKALNIGINFIPLVFLVYLVNVTLLGAYCLAKGYSLKINKQILKFSLVIGTLLFIGTFFTLAALKENNASVIVPIVRMGFVVTAIGAFIFLKEKITFQKGVGIAFAIASLVLLSM